MPQQPYEILQQSALGGFDPVKLRGLQDARKRELQTRMANEVGAGDVPAAQRSGLLAQFLGQDMADDPYTGDAAQARQAGIEGAVDEAATYARPDVTDMRREEQGFQLARANVGGQAARDVATINAQGRMGAAANQPEGWGEPSVNVPDVGSGGVIPVPRSIYNQGGEAVQAFVQQYKGGFGSGMRGQADRTKIDAFNTLIDVLGDTYRQGEAVQWNGIGPVEAPFKSFAKKWLGVGSDEEETLRTQLGRVKTREAFGEGGKQFTGTEERLVNEFLAGSNQSPEMARTRLNAAIQHAFNTLRNLGVPDAEIEAHIARALGGQ